MNQSMRHFNQDFEAMVNLYGERPLFVPIQDGQKTYNYQEVNELIAQHLTWFNTLGLKPGDKIGALIPNSIEMLVVFLSCMRGGYGFAPLACDTSTSEATSWVNLIKPKKVMIGKILPTAVLEGIKNSKIETVTIDHDKHFSNLPKALESISSASGSKLYLYTSGTTGLPKAIVIDGDKLWSSGYSFARQHNMSVDSPFRIWNYLPQSYLGGLYNLCLIPMSVAGSVVIDESFSGKTFLSFWQTVDRFDISALWFVPTIVRGLISVGEKTKRYESKSYKELIKIAFLGTAPVELNTKKQFEEMFGIKLLENYALSETTFITSEKNSDSFSPVEGSVGNVLANIELKFRAVSDEKDPQYQEVLVKTPFIFDGYLDLDGSVKKVMDNDFFPTGDTGFLNEKGQLLITGRCKDIIKKGGQFISLREIELIAIKHPGVENAAAVATAHQFYGESYQLYVKLKSTAQATVFDEVKKFIYDNTTKYKWPDKVELVEEFPQTGSGKIRKFLLKGASL